MNDETVKVRFKGLYKTALAMPGFHGVVNPNQIIDMQKKVYEAEHKDKSSAFELVKKETKKQEVKGEKS